MNKVDLYLKGRRKVPKDPIRRGPILPGENPEYLPRRLSGAIQLYDTGLTVLGGELSFRATAASSTGGATITPLTLAEYDPLYDEIFTVPLNDFADTYRRLSLADFQSDYYRMYIGNGLDTYYSQTDNNIFTNNGLKLPSGFAGSGSFLFLGTPDYIGNTFEEKSFVDTCRLRSASGKITTTRDHSAPGTTYTPRNGDKWFLMPTIFPPYFKTEAFDSGSNLAEIWWDKFRPIPRNYLDSGSPQYNDPLQSIRNSLGGTTGDGWVGAFTQLDFMRSIEVAPEGRHHDDGVVTVIDPDDVPDPTYWPPAGPLPNDALAAAIYYSQPFIEQGNRLTMAAQQGNDWYYFWRTT